MQWIFRKEIRNRYIDPHPCLPVGRPALPLNRGRERQKISSPLSLLRERVGVRVCLMLSGVFADLNIFPQRKAEAHRFD
jgi:hypothetical protein